MRIAAIVAAGLLVCAQTASAQTEQPDAVVKRLFDAMRAKDTTGMRATFHNDMRLVGTGPNRQGVLAAPIIPVTNWLRGIAGAPGAPDERLFDIEVRTDGNLATVWTRYDFFLGETFSHCGYDAFQLFNDKGAWKIIAGADTQRRDPAKCGRGTAPVADTPPTPADTAAVLAPVKQIFDGLRTRDSVALKAAFVPGGKIMAIRGANMTNEDAEAWARGIGAMKTPGELREVMYKPEVRINDNLATVWTYYDFHVGDRFSHCGIDYAQLVKLADGWKIAQLSYTGRQDKCEKPAK